MEEPPNPVDIKQYLPVELARLYGIDKKTFLRQLKPHEEYIGPRNGNYYSALQVKIIFERLGLPGQVAEPTDEG